MIRIYASGRRCIILDITFKGVVAFEPLRGSIGIVGALGSANAWVYSQILVGWILGFGVLAHNRSYELLD
jgi:hypothetical protein